MDVKKIKGFGGRSYGKPERPEGIEKLQQQMKEQFEKIEEEFEKIEVIGTSGGGAVKITAKCNYEVSAIEYDDSLLEDREMFNDLLIAAINEAMREVTKKRNEEFSKVVGFEGLPNL